MIEVRTVNAVALVSNSASDAPCAFEFLAPPNDDHYLSIPCQVTTSSNQTVSATLPVGGTPVDALPGNWTVRFRVGREILASASFGLTP